MKWSLCIEYLYGRCLCPLNSANSTVPSADRLSAVPSLLRLQLPRSSRWRRLRPPATKHSPQSTQRI